MLVNGLTSDCVASDERALHYGDGLFETLAVTQERPCLWESHMQRLAEGCWRLRMPMPDPALLYAESLQQCAGRSLGVLKIVLSRGGGGRGYRIPPNARPNRYLFIGAWPDYPKAWKQEGVRLRLCRTRLGSNPSLAGIKHLNRLEQVLARSEWDDAAVAEGLMRDAAGRVVEGTMTNLFLLHRGRLLTPRLHRCGVLGVMRKLVMRVAGKQGMEVQERDLRLPALYEADALLLTNSLIGIWPVRSFDHTEYDSRAIPRNLTDSVEQLGFCH